MRSILSKDGSNPDPKKVKAILEMPDPEDKKKEREITWNNKLFSLIYSKYVRHKCSNKRVAEK